MEGLVALDRFPKKPCKFCGKTTHWAYECRLNPKKILKRSAIRRATKSLKRSPINKHGKHAKQWLITRATWIRRNPPPIDDKYWVCYLQIHELCPHQLTITTLTLDHVISRSRDPSKRYTLANLKPACGYCNDLKGSRSLDEVKPPAV